MTRRRSEAGLTLIELIVVLAILVALATVAVSSTESLVEQSRWDATNRSLSGIEEAVVGVPSARTPDGVASVTGFVADMGRLPRVPTPDPGGPLRAAELFLQGTAPSFTIASPAGDPDVRVPGGWRGPYLRLPIGTAQLTDGWGRSFVCVDDVGTGDAAPGDVIGAVRALGADGTAGGATYDADVEVVFARSTAPVVARVVGVLAVRVTAKAPAPGEHIVVRVYGPIDGVIGTIAEASVAVLDETPIALPTLIACPIGPRVIRAYQTATLPATPDTVIVSSHRSVVTPIVVVPGGLPEIQLQVQ